MESCVEMMQYNQSTLIIIKQPGSVRHSATGNAIEYIEMRRDEAVELYKQLGKMLDIPSTET